MLDALRTLFRKSSDALDAPHRHQWRCQASELRCECGAVVASEFGKDKFYLAVCNDYVYGKADGPNCGWLTPEQRARRKAFEEKQSRERYLWSSRKGHRLSFYTAELEPCQAEEAAWFKIDMLKNGSWPDKDPESAPFYIGSAYDVVQKYQSRLHRRVGLLAAQSSCVCQSHRDIWIAWHRKHAD